ncbi:MAG: hypothetical protein HKN20_13985 [Gemmatimonadetes bacterium]|nr:hypothetical protein [Gemmatimonadota bacterium]
MYTLQNERGSSLLLALVVLTVVALAGIGLALTTVSDRYVSSFDRESANALHSAEAGLAITKQLIIDEAFTFTDSDGNGQPDFVHTDSLPWGDRFEVFGEANISVAAAEGPYGAPTMDLYVNAFSNRGVRQIYSQIGHGSFLDYARFVQDEGTSYSCAAVQAGKVFVGGDLDAPAKSCDAGAENIFLEDVEVVGIVNDPENAIFMGALQTGVDTIDWLGSIDFDAVRQKAMGLCSNCSNCDGFGEVGIYMNEDPLGIGTNGEIDFSLFDFYTLLGSDTVISYNGVNVPNRLNGNPLKSREFNGIIFYEGDGFVRGTLDGTSGRSITVWAADNVWVMSHIQCGYVGYDEVTRLPNGTGDPVNVGLIGYNHIYIEKFTPQILFIDAAIVAVNENWEIFNEGLGTHSHTEPPAGNYDLDLDGIVGETPVNDYPYEGVGWDEVVTAANAKDTWLLQITGPIITRYNGSAGAWDSPAVLKDAVGPTQIYSYDLDIVDFPPPCFPLPVGSWRNLAWSEVVEVRD